jgi:puromycin-sensitive aminopeptidase
VSHLDDPFRLPRTVLPYRYEVSLTPDLEAATFTGSVSITVTAFKATEIVLNAIELDIHSAAINGLDVPFELHEETERLILTAPYELSDDSRITLTFSGILNDKLRGWYRSTFTDESGRVRTIATSQMQSTDCRRAFPCFDEPDFKAVFAIKLTVADGLMAISNSKEIQRETNPDGTSTIWFADTMKMSTYLVAFVVGPLEATEPVMVGNTPVRVIHIPGKSHLTDFGMRAGVFALEWFERYYGIPYPGDKVDLLALPDFAAGAMENVGCITFREVLLLVDPATSTQVEQELVALVVAHELAHMWFGDLVTMRWWNGIWLNEAFATFMEYAACDAFAPQWKLWTTFGLDRTAAFEVDSLHNTRTVEFPVNSPADADGMFDVLTYQKGGALLRMLEQFIGPERFQAGVSHYLRTHSYGNTETNDLWDAIEHIVETDGGPVVPVRRLMDSWIWQAGFPQIWVAPHADGITLSQSQFSFDDERDPTLWVVPIHVRNGGQEIKVLLDSDSVHVPLPDPSGPVIVNAGGNGYFRVTYSPELNARLTKELVASLSTIERYNLVDDAWSSVVAGAMDGAAYVEMVSSVFKEERELAVWQAIAVSLRSIFRIVDPSEVGILEYYIENWVGAALEDIGWQPAQDEDDLTSKLRGLFVQLLGIYGSDEVTISRCRGILFDSTITEPELVAAATNVVAATGDVQDYEWFLNKYTNATTPQERIRMLYALAEFNSEELMERTTAFAFTDAVKTQDAPFLLNRCIANRHHGVVAWAAVRKNWVKANKEFPGNTIVRMISSVTTLNSESLEAEVQAFFSEHTIPQATKTLDQVLERQRVNVALRKREENSLAKTLMGH